jgi:hypothetical protein
MTLIPLTTALSNLLACEPKNLAEFLNNPLAVNKAVEFLKGKKLRTSYLDKQGEFKEVRCDGISLKSVADQFAFEGYLGLRYSSKFI